VIRQSARRKDEPWKKVGRKIWVKEFLSHRAAVVLWAFGGDSHQLIGPPIRTVFHVPYQGRAEARSPSKITCLTVRLLMLGLDGVLQLQWACCSGQHGIVTLSVSTA